MDAGPNPCACKDWVIPEKKGADLRVMIDTQLMQNRDQILDESRKLLSSYVSP